MLLHQESRVLQLYCMHPVLAVNLGVVLSTVICSVTKQLISV